MSDTQTTQTPETAGLTQEVAAPEVVTPESLFARAGRIAKEIEGLAIHDAILVFHFLTEHLASGVSREKAIVKTKFEEAMMWLNRHTIGLLVKQAQDAQAAQTENQASDAPAAETVTTEPAATENGGGIVVNDSGAVHPEAH